MVEAAVDEPIGTGNLGHADGDILRLGENLRSLESLPQGSTVRPRVGGVGGRVKGNDGVDVAVGDEEGFNGDILVGQASIDEGDVREVRDLDQSAGVFVQGEIWLTGLVSGFQFAKEFGNRATSLSCSPMSFKIDSMASTMMLEALDAVRVRRAPEKRVDEVPAAKLICQL